MPALRNSSSITSATASPARSWSTRSGVPAAIAAASSARISATDTTANGSGTAASSASVKSRH
jgi:hypothetical protein